MFEQNFKFMLYVFVFLESSEQQKINYIYQDYYWVAKFIWKSLKL